MARYAKRDFQIGDYWLSRRGNSPAWCRTWFDRKTRQTRRVSLGTTDIEEAKKLLTDWFVLNHKSQSKDPEDHLLSEIVARYYDKHGKYVVSASSIRTFLGYWLDFFDTRTVAEISDAELQREFQVWLRARGMKVTTVKHVLSAGRAAINYAWKRGEIVQPPFILPVSEESGEVSPPKGRPLDINEIVSLYESTANPNLRMFIILMIATAARPDAIRELTRDRMLIEDRLIVLNPEHRQQTKKYRPTLRMPESIVPLVEQSDETPSIHMVGGGDKPLKSVRTSWRTARAKSGLDDQVNPYSIRHTMARWLRKEGVPAWEVSAQLGHKRQELSITEIYAPYDPGYLSEATKAIDSFFDVLRASSVLIDQMLDGITY